MYLPRTSTDLEKENQQLKLELEEARAEAGEQIEKRIKLESRLLAARAECAVIKEACLEAAYKGCNYCDCVGTIKEDVKLGTIGREYQERVERLVKAAEFGHGIVKDQSFCKCDDGKPDECWVNEALKEFEK